MVTYADILLSLLSTFIFLWILRIAGRIDRENDNFLVNSINSKDYTVSFYRSKIILGFFGLMLLVLLSGFVFFDVFYDKYVFIFLSLNLEIHYPAATLLIDLFIILVLFLGFVLILLFSSSLDLIFDLHSYFTVVVFIFFMFSSLLGYFPTIALGFFVGVVAVQVSYNLIFKKLSENIAFLVGHIAIMSSILIEGLTVVAPTSLFSSYAGLILALSIGFALMSWALHHAMRKEETENLFSKDVKFSVIKPVINVYIFAFTLILGIYHGVIFTLLISACVVCGLGFIFGLGSGLLYTFLADFYLATIIERRKSYYNLGFVMAVYLIFWLSSFSFTFLSGINVVRVLYFIPSIPMLNSQAVIQILMDRIIALYIGGAVYGIIMGGVFSLIMYGYKKELVDKLLLFTLLDIKNGSGQWIDITNKLLLLSEATLRRTIKEKSYLFNFVYTIAEYFKSNGLVVKVVENNNSEISNVFVLRTKPANFDSWESSVINYIHSVIENFGNFDIRPKKVASKTGLSPTQVKIIYALSENETIHQVISVYSDLLKFGVAKDLKLDRHMSLKIATLPNLIKKLPPEFIKERLLPLLDFKKLLGKATAMENGLEVIGLLLKADSTLINKIPQKSLGKLLQKSRGEIITEYIYVLPSDISLSSIYVVYTKLRDAYRHNLMDILQTLFKKKSSLLLNLLLFSIFDYPIDEIAGTASKLSPAAANKEHSLILQFIQSKGVSLNSDIYNLITTYPQLSLWLVSLFPEKFKGNIINTVKPLMEYDDTLMIATLDYLLSLGAFVTREALLFTANAVKSGKISLLDAKKLASKPDRPFDYTLFTKVDTVSDFISSVNQIVTT